ncbi:MAG: 50S ribosomal protein L25/general stress protein Ctc [Flavobacteriaceae bacterium]|nr:50S ribosomal protein L25/general stress protein Ctc [Flavobacteriaceae bacterium]|tara:strand:+ start:997 stop:1713 length:717 start_codon:yes stop_codon:yes gene_type:complete
MKSITINGSKRESVGKKASKDLRNAGKVPCVIYGGDEPVHFSADEISFSKLVYTADAHTVVVAFEDGNKIDAVLQDIQFHPVTDKILHIDFFQLHEGKEINMIIPVRIEGTAPGVRDSGGLLSRNKRKLTVRALPKNLPDFLLADVSKLNLNDSITVADLADETFKILHPDSQVVCQVKMSRASMSIDEDIDDEELEEGETSESADASGDSKSSEAGDTSKSDEGKSNDKKDEKSDNN